MDNNQAVLDITNRGLDLATESVKYFILVAGGQKQNIPFTDGQTVAEAAEAAGSGWSPKMTYVADGAVVPADATPVEGQQVIATRANANG